VPHIRLCRECGVPLAVSREQMWHDNGVVTQTADPEHRMLFSESDNIDALFANIESIIGVPIEHVVIESKRKEVREYVEKMVSPLERRLARRAATGLMVAKLSRTGRTYGFGDISYEGRRHRGDAGDYVTMGVRRPHSIPFFCGEVLGAWEAIDGREHGVEYERVGDGEYLVTVRPGEHPVGLHERLLPRRYRLRRGDVFLRRCGTCWVPLEVARHTWNIPEGTITHRETGRRMAIFGPAGLEAILDDLEAELGSTIPDAIIEAERRCVREAGSGMEWLGTPESYREMFAVRGLGNLVTLEAGERRVAMTIENSCVNLVTVGMAKGLFELAVGVSASTVEWSSTPEGTLAISLEV